MKRAERTQRTREAILEAAAQEFEACGYSKATLQAVADRLGIVKGTVLFHFQSKDALRQNLIEWANERLSEAVTECQDFEQWRSMLSAIAELYYKDARIRAGLMLHDEDIQNDAYHQLEWEQKLAIQTEKFIKRKNDIGSAIARQAMQTMYSSIIRRRWRDMSELLQALDFMFSLLAGYNERDDSIDRYKKQ